MTRISRQAVGALHPDLFGAIRTHSLTGGDKHSPGRGSPVPRFIRCPISEEIMQNYEQNVQETWTTNSMYAKVNRRN